MASEWDPRLTEAVNPRTAQIDRADAATIVRLMQAEDRSIPIAMASQADAIARVIDAVVDGLRRGGRLIYVGAGTSGRLGVLDAAECPPTFGTDPSSIVGVIAGGEGALIRSSEGAEDDPAAGRRAIEDLGVTARDFVLGIATSGTTPFVHGALGAAHGRGAGLGFLSCSEPPPSIVEMGALLVTPLVGPEVVAGSTRLKAGTATKLALNTISTGVMIRSGRVYGNLMVDLRARSAKLADRGIRIVSQVAGVGREEARSLLVNAGGAVKTALAMRLLGVGRWAAETALDVTDGFLAEAVSLFGDRRVPEYEGYPEAPDGDDIPRLLEDLAAAPDRLRASLEHLEDAERQGRVPPHPGGWGAARHVAHLLQFEVEAVEPRVRRWVEELPRDPASPAAGLEPAFAEWQPADPPPGPGGGLDGTLARFEEARARTLVRLRGADPAFWTRRARIGVERPTLHQFLRGVRHHDRAHAARIEERVHPDLLEPVATPPRTGPDSR